MSAIFCDTQSAAVAIVELSDEQRHDIRKTIVSEWCARNCDDEWDYADGLVDCDVPEDEAQKARDAMTSAGCSIYWLSSEPIYGTLRLVAPLRHVAAYLVDVVVQYAVHTWSQDGSDVDEIIDDITQDCVAIDDVLKLREVVTVDPTRDYGDSYTDTLRDHFGDRDWDRIQKGIAIAKALDIIGLDWTCEALRNVADWDDEDDPECLRRYRAKWIRLQDPALGLSGCQYNSSLDSAWRYFREDVDDAAMDERCRLQHAEEQGELDEDDDIDDLVSDYRCSIIRSAEKLREDTSLDWT